MQAYKLKGTIDPSGHLIIDEPINLSPGEVEVIILQPVTQAEESKVPTATSPTEVSKQRLRARVKSLKELLENAPPVPPDFDPEQARWEALKEKYEL